jgi:hypothetical protein
MVSVRVWQLLPAAMFWRVAALKAAKSFLLNFSYRL